MENILVPLALFATIVVIVYIYYITRNKERLALINKGVGASIFNGISSTSSFSFKIGFFLVGTGIGALIGNILTVYTSMNEGVAYFSMIMILSGLSLIIARLLEKRIANI